MHALYTYRSTLHVLTHACTIQMEFVGLHGMQGLGSTSQLVFVVPHAVISLQNSFLAYENINWTPNHVYTLLQGMH